MADFLLSQIKIQGSLAVETVASFQMDVGVNRHGRLRYCGLINQSDAQRITYGKIAAEQIVVFLAGELEFCGYPSDVFIEEENEIYLLCVELSGYGRKADEIPHNRFYQDVNSSFAQIMQEGLDDSGDGGNLIATQGQNEIQTPILQYRETDWAFILRMAGNCSTVVIPNLQADKPQFLFGLPQRAVQAEDSPIWYKINKQAKSNLLGNCALPEGDAFCVRLRSENNYKLGDNVQVLGRSLTVMEKSFQTAEGRLIGEFVLAAENVFCMRQIPNDSVTGLELRGTVEAVSGERLQLVLDIDASRGQKGLSWFPFAPTTNNGMYSMPLTEESVMLQWQGADGSDLLVVRADRANSADMPSPDHYIYATEHKNQLAMIPGNVSFLSPKNRAMLSDAGISLKTSGALVMEAKNVNWKSKIKLRVFSPEKIIVKRSDGEGFIRMESGKIHILSKNTRLATNPQGEWFDPLNRTIGAGASIPVEIAAKLQGGNPTCGSVAEGS